MDANCANHINSDSNWDEILTLNEWVSIKKEVTYKLYVQLFKELTAKEEFICGIVTKIAKDRMTADSAAGEGVMGVSSSTGEGLRSEQVRVFKANPPKKEENNIVFGSSIAAKLEKDKSLPHDCSLYASRGSTTKEKLTILDDYLNKRLKTFIIQDGTNIILKSNKSAGDIFSEINELVIKCKDKFEPDVFVLCEVTPLKNRLANSDKNKLIDEFNELLLEKFDNDSSGIQVLEVNQINRKTLMERCRSTINSSTIMSIWITHVVYQRLKIFCLVIF